jgi:LDH2 family malate/lactate/ureidoglycolate dehydrogenase
MSQRFNADALVDFSVDVLTGKGADETQARIFAEALVWSDRIGRPTHGVWRLPAYVKRFVEGLIKCPCEPTFVQGGASIAAMDGDSGFGHVVGHYAMEKAIEMAAETGVGVVTAKHSNHFGTGGYFVDLAAQRGMLGIATSNSIAKLAPFGGVAPVFGTNPLALGVPRGNGQGIILDMATAAVSGASVIRAAENGETLPEGVLVDRQGNPMTDATRADEGAMLPFGGAKGAGLAFFVELLSGVISGAALSTGVRSMFNNFTGNGDNGHCFIAIDLSKLMPLEIYYARLEDLVAQMKAASPEGGPELRLPGESRWRIMAECAAEGVKLDDKMLAALQVLADQHGLSLPA